MSFGLLNAAWLRGQQAPEPEKPKAGSKPHVLPPPTGEHLYGTLMLALMRQYGDKSDEIKVETIAEIRKIPNHAKWLGDKIDKLSNEFGTGRKREKCFYLLQHVASTEAIAQIGRFLFDDRNPEKDLPLNDGSFEVPNSLWAAEALGAALGHKVLGDEVLLNRKPGFYGPTEVKVWQTWWQTPAADKYRLPPR